MARSCWCGVSESKFAYLYQFELDPADRAGRFHVSDTDPVANWGILSVMGMLRQQDEFLPIEF